MRLSKGHKKPAFDRKPMPKAKKGTLPRIIKLLLSDYKWMLLFAMFCMAAFCVGNVTPSIFIKNITDIIINGQSLGWDAVAGEVVQMLLIMAAILLLATLCSFLYSRFMAVITQGFMNNMRKRMFERMQTLPIKYFDSHGHGDIMSYYTNDIDTLEQLISQSLPHLVQSALILVCLVSIMLYYSMDLMLVMVFGVIAMFFAVKKVGGRSASYFVSKNPSVKWRAM